MYNNKIIAEGMACCNQRATFSAKCLGRKVFVMSIKRNLFVLFMIVMMAVTVAACADGSGKSGEVASVIEDVTDVKMELGEDTESNRNTGQAVETTRDGESERETMVTFPTDSSVSDSDDITKNLATEESNAEVATEIPTDATVSAEPEQAEEYTHSSTETSDSELTVSEPTKPEASESEVLEPIIYDPYQVVNLVIAKCQAGGMITTEDNLANLLAEGKITQAEYDEYYPLDGLEGSYYSVFVETDLNLASDIVGNKLGSVDGIADYIANMLLLETQPIFNVTYAGVYTLNGVEFYEFRCHR